MIGFLTLGVVLAYWLLSSQDPDPPNHVCPSGPFGSWWVGLDRHQHQPYCPQRKA